jgi:predicted amidophosphoribosyltransferase
MSVISDLEESLAAAKAAEAKPEEAPTESPAEEKTEKGLCKDCAQFLTPNGIEWQKLCPKCYKKFVS